MNKKMTKIVILVVILITIIALFTTLAIVKIKIGDFEILSIKDIALKDAEIKKANTNFLTYKTNYNGKGSELANALKEYNTEKSKYEAISDETIAIIEEATKEEKYFIEYLWVILGNYAKLHDLKLMVIDPGSKIASEKQPTAEKKTDTKVTTEKDALVTTVSSSNLNLPTGDKTEGTANSTIKPKDKVITIQLTGNYINVADFVFEIENDKTLRFKLDNILMKAATGNNIVAIFEVKNLVIIK